MVETAPLVEHLNDVESELRFDDLRNLSGLHVFERRGKRRVETGERRRVHFAAAHHRSGVLRIHAGQILELGLARDDAFAHVQQTLARTLLGLRDRLGETGDLRIDILLGDGRQAVLVDRLVETLDLTRNDCDLAHDLVLHGAGVGLLLVALTHVLADVENGHVVLGFEPGNRSLGLDHVLHLLLDVRSDVAGIDLHRVDLRLIEEQFLGHQRFERLVHRIAVGGVPLRAALRRELARVIRHLGIENRGRTHDGDHLVEHHLLFLGESPRSEHGESRRHYTFFQHCVILYRLYFQKSSPPRSPRRGCTAPPRGCG